MSHHHLDIVMGWDGVGRVHEFIDFLGAWQNQVMTLITVGRMGLKT